MVSQVRVTRAVNNQGDGTLFDRSQSTPLTREIPTFGSKGDPVEAR